MPREIVVHVLRHGHAQGSEPEDELTPTGEAQARAAGHDLLKHIPEDAVVKFYSSPFRRAVRTRELLEHVVKAERPVLRPRERVELAYMKRFREDWEEKEYEEALADLTKSLVDLPRRLSRKMAAGPAVHLVFVSHAGSRALNALVEKLSGKSLSQLGGNIGNCERFVLHFKPGEAPTLGFRFHSAPIPG